MTPTAELRKIEWAQSGRADPLFLLCTEPGDSCGKSKPFPSTRRRPTVDHYLVAGGAQRQWLQACLPDGHQPQCQPLYVPSAHKHLNQKASAAVAAILEKKKIADASIWAYDRKWLISPILAKLTSPCACGRAPRPAGVARHSAARRPPWPSKSRALRSSRSSHRFW